MLGCSSTRNYILIKVLAGLINDEVEWVERTPGFIISTSLVDHRDNHVAIQSLMSWRTTNSNDHYFIVLVRCSLKGTILTVQTPELLKLSVPKRTRKEITTYKDMISGSSRKSPKPLRIAMRRKYYALPI